MENIPSKDIMALARGFFFLFFTYNGVEKYIVPYLSALGMFMLGLAYLSLFVGDFVSPWIISRIGTKKAMMWGAATYFLFAVCIPLQSLWFNIPSAMAAGMGAALVWNGMSTHVIFSCHKTGENVDRSFSWILGYFGLGSALGLAAFSLVSGYLDVGHTFWALAPVALIGLWAFSRMESTTQTDTVSFREIWRAYRNPTLLRLASESVTAFMLFSLLVTQIPLAIGEVWGEWWIGLMSAMAFIALLLCLVMDKLIKRLGKTKFVFIAYFMLLTGLAMLIAYDLTHAGTWLLVSGVILVCVSFAPLDLIMLGMANLAPPHKVLVAQAVFTSADDIAMSSGLFVALLLEERGHSLEAMYYLAFAVTAFSLILLLPLLKGRDMDEAVKRLAVDP